MKEWDTLAADLVQHLAVLGHGLNQILGNNVLHNKIPPKLSVKCSVFLAGSDVPLNQAWGYYSIGCGRRKGAILTCEWKILTSVTCFLMKFG